MTLATPSRPGRVARAPSCARLAPPPTGPAKTGVGDIRADAAVGVGAAVASGRVLDSLLFEIGPTDPASFGAATVLLLGIALVASYVPARRASRADPFVTLKTE